MPWYVWVPFAAFGSACVLSFARSYRHIRPEMEKEAHRSVLRGPLMRQNLFTDRGSQLRLFGWLWACCAMGVLIVWGLVERTP
jgi:hypothetical protein